MDGLLSRRRGEHLNESSQLAFVILDGWQCKLAEFSKVLD